MCRSEKHLLSSKSVCFEAVLENVCDGKAMSSISTSKYKFDRAKSPSMSLKIKRPVSRAS